MPNLTFAKRITAALILGVVGLAGAVYAFPEQLLPQLFAHEVNLEKIYLNDVSQLADVRGEVRLNGQPAKTGATVKAGDTLQTGADGAASIVYFEDSVTRLAPATTFTILQLERPVERPLSGQIRGQLQQGSAWNKVVRPLDPTATFAVESNTTVATIRGSAFDMTVGENGTTVASVEHGLQLAVRDPATGQTLKSEVVPEGVAAVVDTTNQQPNVVQKTIPPEVLQSQWFRANEKEDTLHVQTVERKIEERKREVLAVPTNAAARFLQQALQDKVDAARLAEATSPTEKAAVQATIVRRELLAAEVNNAPLAARSAILEQFSSNPVLQNDLALVEKGYAQLPSTAPEYALKATVMELRTTTAPDTETKKAFEMRALRETVLDVQDDQKRADLTPADQQKLQTLENNLKTEAAKILPPPGQQPTEVGPPREVNLQQLSTTLLETRAAQPVPTADKNTPPPATFAAPAPPPTTRPATEQAAPKPIAPPPPTAAKPTPKPISAATDTKNADAEETHPQATTEKIDGPKPPNTPPPTTAAPKPVAPPPPGPTTNLPPPPTSLTPKTNLAPPPGPAPAPGPAPIGTSATTATTTAATTGSGTTSTSTSTSGTSSTSTTSTSTSGTSSGGGGGGGGTITTADTIPPVVTALFSSTPNGYFSVGQHISIGVRFSEPIVATGTPTLALVTNISASGTAGVTVLPLVNRSTDALFFDYVVAAGHTAPNLETAGQTALSLAGGTITDLIGNPAILTLPVPGGANSLSSQRAFAVDTTVPTISVTPPTAVGGGLAYTFSEDSASGSITFVATGGTADPNPTHVCQLAGTALTAGTHANFQFVTDPNVCSAWSNLVEGASYTVTFAATDRAGNVATPVIFNNVLHDKTPPAVTGAVTTGVAGLNGWYKTDLLYTLTPYDNSSGVDQILFCVDLVDACTPATVYSIPVAVNTESATNFVRWKARDSAGNWQPVQTSGPLKIDKTAPAFTAAPVAQDKTSGSTSITNETAVNLFWHDFDATSGNWAWAVKESSTTPTIPAANDPGWQATPILNFTLAATSGATTNLYFWVMDAAGNVSNLGTHAILFDTLAP